MIASEPDKFLLPRQSDLRFNWGEVRPHAIDDIEMRELVVDAWRMVVPKRVATNTSASDAATQRHKSISPTTCAPPQPVLDAPVADVLHEVPNAAISVSGLHLRRSRRRHR